MKAFYTEVTVGAFMILGIACMGYLSVRLGGMEIWGHGYYQVSAAFSNVGGLKPGAPVVIAGVTVGRVDSISLKDYAALVVLKLEDGLTVQQDAIASVRTQGLIGEKFVEISPGGAPDSIPPGGKIMQTEPAIDLESLIGKYRLRQSLRTPAMEVRL